MQAKRPIAKLVKLPSKFPSWKTFKRQWNWIALQWEKLWNVSGETDAENKEIDLK